MRRKRVSKSVGTFGPTLWSLGEVRKKLLESVTVESYQDPRVSRVQRDDVEIFVDPVRSIYVGSKGTKPQSGVHAPSGSSSRKEEPFDDDSGRKVLRPEGKSKERDLSQS